MNDKVYLINALCFSQEASLCIEVQGIRLSKGTGDITITGNLGSIAHESMLVAKTLIGMMYPVIYEYDYHLHFTYHTTKKEGTSWGLACFIILSFLCGRIEYKKHVAATGEIDLSGSIKPVKYIDEKLAAWAKSNCHTLFIPKDNRITSNNNGTVYQVTKVEQVWSILEGIKQ